MDITDRKRAEEELKEAKAQAELYLDLMGHDINNMNQIAMGFLEIAIESFPLKDEERKFLEKPLDTLKNSAMLIENVRKLQKLEAGKSEVPGHRSMRRPETGDSRLLTHPRPGRDHSFQALACLLHRRERPDKRRVLQPDRECHQAL